MVAARQRKSFYTMPDSYAGPVVPHALAKASGAKLYFTEKPCVHGHIAQRRVSSRMCVICDSEHCRAWGKNNTEWNRTYGREYMRKRLNDPAYRAKVNQRVKARRKKLREEAAGGPRPDKCSVCGRKKHKIVFDHCHQSGQFRGWLCESCNAVIGMANDDPALLRKLADYLEAASAVMRPLS